MCTSKPSKPDIPPPPPPPVEAPRVSPEAKKAKTEQQNKAKQNLGRKSTMLTGPQGLEDNARTAGKTLLGQ